MKRVTLIKKKVSKNKISKNKISKKKGGEPKFLASGTYGCVYNPPIKCQDKCNDIKCKNYENVISKYMNNTYATEEYQIFNNLQLKSINNTQQYHIGNPYKCKPSVDFKPNPYECDKNPEKSAILLYENGGQDLDFYLKKPVLPYIFLSNIENILEFILKMIKFGIAHTDIKKDNIVAGINGNHYRLIDFGLGIKFKDNFVYERFFSRVYSLWLCSTLFLSKHVTKISDENIEKYTHEFYNKNEKSKYLKIFMTKNGIDEYTLKNILIKVREKIKAGQSIFTILKLIDLYSFTKILDNYLYVHIDNFFPKYSTHIDILFMKFLDDTQIYNPDPFKICSSEEYYIHFKKLKYDIKNLNITHNNIKINNINSFEQLYKKKTYKNFETSV